MSRSPPLISAFGRLSTGHLPDVHQLDERLQVFWILTAAKSDPDMQFLAPAQVSDILCAACDVSVTRQRSIAILERAKKTGHVASIKRSGKNYFKIMKRGEDDLVGVSAAPMFVDPAKALT